MNQLMVAAMLAALLSLGLVGPHASRTVIPEAHAQRACPASGCIVPDTSFQVSQVRPEQVIPAIIGDGGALCILKIVCNS